MEPSEKSVELTEALERMAGRTTAIHFDRCIPEPIGCGSTITEFRDELSVREYMISGMCQECQDEVFGV